METRIKKHLCALMLITSLTVPVHAIYSDISELSPALLKKIEMIAVSAADTHVKRVVQPRKWITTGRLLKVGIPVAVIGVGGYYAGRYLYNKFRWIQRGVEFVRGYIPAPTKLVKSNFSWVRNTLGEFRNTLNGIQQQLGEVISNVAENREEIAVVRQRQEEDSRVLHRVDDQTQAISENMATKQDISGMQRAVDGLRLMVSSLELNVRTFFNK